MEHTDFFPTGSVINHLPTTQTDSDSAEILSAAFDALPDAASANPWDRGATA